MQNKRKQTAFSLVELSIVLIIIGLLIAGVVGGSSLIKSATLRSIMSEGRNYGIVTNSFYVAYDALPGDISSGYASPSPNSLSSGCVGNSNGRIEFFNAPPPTVVTASNVKGYAEGLCAIYQLKDSGMLQTENLTAISDSSAFSKLRSDQLLEVQVHYPQSKNKGTGWVFDYVSGSDNTFSSTSWRSIGNEEEPANVVYLFGEKFGGGTVGAPVELAAGDPYQSTHAIAPQDAFSIDSKIDDGKPKSGKLRAFGKDDNRLNESVRTSVVDPCVTSTDMANYLSSYQSTNKYNVEFDRKACVLGFGVDVLR